LLALFGRFDLLNAFLELFFKDFSHKLASLNVQEIIEIVEVATIGGSVADLIAIVE
jgi:hypothetical protein